MLRLLIVAALLCVASPARSQVAFRDFSTPNFASVQVINGEPVLVIVGYHIELRWNHNHNPVDRVELGLVGASVLGSAPYQGDWWGEWVRSSDTFIGWVQIDRLGVITLPSTFHRFGWHSPQWYEGASFGPSYGYHDFGGCYRQWGSYIPCVMGGGNPLAAMVFKVRMR